MQRHSGNEGAGPWDCVGRALEGRRAVCHDSIEDLQQVHRLGKEGREQADTDTTLEGIGLSK